MKKALTIATLFIMLITLTLTGVKASRTTLANDLYTKLEPYGATNSDKVRVERYLAENDVTAEQESIILGKVDEAIAVMQAEGVTDYNKLSESGRNKVKALAQEAADVIGLTLIFTQGRVEVYNKTGKLLDTQKIAATSGTLAYTGNNNVSLVVSSIAVIALAAIVVAKKGFAKVGE